MPSYGDDLPWDFALRWSPLFQMSTVWPVISRMLVEPDPVIRTRALEFANSWSGNDALSTGRTIRELALERGIDRARVDELLDPARMTEPGMETGPAGG